MVPVAPALLSTMKVPPTLSCSLGMRVRAIRSVEPPGGKGTTMVTGLSGQARAEVMVNAAATAHNSFFMFVSLG